MITVTSFETIIGTMIAASVDDGIVFLEFADRKTLSKEYKFLEVYFKTRMSEGENDHLTNLRNQLEEYFTGIRKEFKIPFITAGTKFQQSVWKELMNIGYGQTRSYHQQAVAMGISESVRAVANANSLNRIAVLIPCHRVIGSNGRLTGYSGGLERKRWLLKHEKAFSGKAYELSIF